MLIKAADTIEELETEVQNWKITASEEASGLEHWFENYQKDVQRWIPVSERLPEEYKVVLLMSMSGEVISGYYDSEYKIYCDMTGFRKLYTHWMPLPEPPKEET